MNTEKTIDFMGGKIRIVPSKICPKDTIYLVAEIDGDRPGERKLSAAKAVFNLDDVPLTGSLVIHDLHDRYPITSREQLRDLIWECLEHDFAFTFTPTPNSP
jgi:hypothetical protein